MVMISHEELLLLHEQPFYNIVCRCIFCFFILSSDIEALRNGLLMLLMLRCTLFLGLMIDHVAASGGGGAAAE